MDMREAGLERGRKAGEGAAANPDFGSEMQWAFRYALALYPSLGDVDLGAMVRDYDAKRLADEPDYAVFPEMRGLIDRHVAEREAFKEVSGLDDTACAFHHSWAFMLSRYINAHHLARYDLATPAMNCTNVFIPHGKDGVTIADNRDDVVKPAYYEKIPAFRPGAAAADAKVNWLQGGASSACLMDEEPSCIFPCSAHEMMPDECLDDINDIKAFMERYREFWGPGNQLFVDRKLDAVAVEKTNCRVAYREPTVNGAVCITACSYLDPDLNAYKKEQTRKAMAIKGETEADCPDWEFFEGCDARQRRLIKLVNECAANGGDLWDAFYCVADTKVPMPDRVCLAGEKTTTGKDADANWTLTQHAAVITGPKRRVLYRSMQDLRQPRSIMNYTPKLRLGKGVAMEPSWQADIDQGRCELDDAD